MTGGGGFVVCILGVILGVVICKPQECVRVPQWTIDGENPLQRTKGNVTLVALLRMTSHFGQQQALRMEILLHDLRDYGMLDLSFIIVNSKDDRSDEILNNFRRILSFPIYQGTDEKIRTIIGGSDNDMFLYDRCGRLTYFIPHPMSNLLDKHTVVRAAILSTYFRSPCGISCPSNEIVDNIEIQLEDEHQIRNDSLTDREAETVHYPNGTGVLLDVEDDFPVFDNETTHAEYEGLEDYDGSMASYNNFSTINNISANASSDGVLNITSSRTRKGILSSFFNFIWGKGKSKKSENSVEEIIHELFASNLTDDVQLRPDINIEISNFSILETLTTTENTTNIPIANRDRIDSCFGADKNVCIDWSKGKLMHAQRCCMITSRRRTGRRGEGCKNFGKKRCKKIQLLLKCCLKTEMLGSPDEEPLHGAAM